MSNMDSHSRDREPFANHWRKAMEEVEISPSDSVWSLITKSLDILKYRHRAQIYSLVAAIAVLITIIVSIQSQWLGSDPYSGNFYLSQNEVQNSLNDTSLLIGPRTASDRLYFLDSKEKYANSEHPKLVKKSSSLVMDKKILRLDKKEYHFLDKNSVDKKIITPILASYPLLFLKKSLIIERDHLWAGINFGGSSFNPNYELINAGDMLSAGGLNQGFLTDQEGRVTSLNENMLVGINRKIEVNLGMTIKDRFVLEGGLQYVQTELVQQSNFMVETISYPTSMSPQNPSPVAESTNKGVQKTQEIAYKNTETELENRIDYASVPLRAGFIFLDQRLSLRLNAGLVTNFYLGNIHRSLDDPTPLAEFTTSDNALYRNISFSGQTGMSLGYRLLQNVDVTFEPNYTQSFQSITRSYVGFSSIPNGFGVMAGVRYNFN